MGPGGKEQRRELRAKVSQRLRVRIPDSDHSAEICQAHNLSRSGPYFVIASTHYLPGMNICVIRNFDPDKCRRDGQHCACGQSKGFARAWPFEF